MIVSLHLLFSRTAAARLGDEALRFIRSIAPSDSSERTKAIQQLHRSLGATLQRVVAVAVIAATSVGQ